MTSINTNVAALQSLRTLEHTNSRLQESQERIASGLRIRSSRDDAIDFATAQRLRGQARTLGNVSESLSGAQGVFSTTASALSFLQELANSIRSDIIQAQDVNFNSADLQASITELVDQVGNRVRGAIFNGTNLLDGRTEPFRTLTGVENSGGGNALTFSSFNALDLRTTGVSPNGLRASTFDGSTDAKLILDQGYAPGDADSLTVTLQDTSVTPAVAFSQKIVINPLDDLAAIASSIESAITGIGTGDLANVRVSAVGGPPEDELSFLQTGGSTIEFISGTLAFTGGGLNALNNIDVTTPAGATKALVTIDAVLAQISDATFQVGVQQKNFDFQSDFTNRLIDSLDAGVSALVDANLAEESVLLNQLQTRQELGIEALGIANEGARLALRLFQN